MLLEHDISRSYNIAVHCILREEYPYVHLTASQPSHSYTLVYAPVTLVLSWMGISKTSVEAMYILYIVYTLCPEDSIQYPWM